MASVLTLVAQQAAHVTAADGVAIAIGNAMAMCCCASVGDAPPVGVLVGPDSGLSGLCMRTSQLVWCDDCATDDRIDPVARQQMNLRSVLIVPVIADGRLQAMLQAVSSRPRAFDAEQQKLLSRMAERIATLLSQANAELNQEPPAAEDRATSPSAAGDSHKSAAAVAATPSSPADGRDRSAPASAIISSARLITRPEATPQPEAGDRKSGAAARRVPAEATQGFRPEPSPRSAFSSTAKAGGLIAVLVVLAIGVYEFTGVGRRTSGAATPVPAARNAEAGAPSREVSDAAPPEISIEQSPLAISLQPASTGGANAPQLTSGQLLHKVEPVFPPSLRGMSGSVVLSAVIGKDGRVASVRVVRGPQELASPAVDAVRQWVYEPYRLGGVPVAAESTIVIKVTPRRRQ